MSVIELYKRGLLSGSLKEEADETLFFEFARRGYDLSRLRDMLSAEKEEKRALMPTVDDKPKSRNWLLRLVGAR